MIVFLSIDSAEMKRKRTSLSTFLAKKVVEVRPFMSIDVSTQK